jgi:thiol-disulfide isomerase/thioredoxin
LNGGVVQLEPETWVGRELPLRDYVVNGQELMQGKWTVLLFRPGCGHCDDVKIRLSEQAKSEFVRVAFLDIASRTVNLDVDTKVKLYRLTSDVSWVADTPIVLELQGGIVRNVQLRAQLQ